LIIAATKTEKVAEISMGTELSTFSKHWAYLFLK